MTQLMPSDRSTQPKRTAVRLAVQDELRSLSFNLQHGAEWLINDVGAGLAKRGVLPEPTGPLAPLGKLQQMIGSTAQQALSSLQSAQHAAASTVLDAAPYRALDFQLQPLLAYFSHTDTRHPSRQFTDVFYWLIRHLLDGRITANAAPAGTALTARQCAVDEAYWLVVANHDALLSRLHAEVSLSASGMLRPDDNALLCAAVFQELLAAQPVRDPSLPPWADRALPDSDAPALKTCLLTAVIAAGLAQTQIGEVREVADALRLAHQLVAARLPHFEVAINKPNAGTAIAAEMAFTLRHA